MFSKLLNQLKNFNYRGSSKKYIEFSSLDYALKNYFWDGNKHDSGNKFIEAAIFDMFLANISSFYSIIPHVSLREIFVTIHNEEWYPYLSFLSTHHVDFLILDRISARPVLALEVCGSYHKDDVKQIKSDNFKKSLFKQAEIPLFWIDLDSNLLDKNFYISLFQANQHLIPVYHTPCNHRMLFVESGPFGPYYKCSFCTRDDGQLQTVSLSKIPDIIPYNV